MKQVKKLAQLSAALLLAIILNFGLNPRPAYAINSAVTGNWNVGATWVGAAVPGVGDSAVILNTHIVTMNATPGSSVVSLTVNNGGKLDDSALSTLTVTGTVTIDAGGTIDFTTQNSTLTITGGASDLTVNGTYTDGSGNIAVGNNATVGDGGTFTLGGGNVNVTGALNVGGGVSGLLNDSGTSALTVGGSVTIAAGGTINFGGNNSTLTITGGASDLTVNGTYTDGSGNIAVGNDVIFGAAGAFTPAAGTVIVGGDWNRTAGGGFTNANSTVVFTDTADHTITGTNIFNNLVFGPLTGLARTLTFPDGVVTTVSDTLTLQGAVGNILTLASSAAAQWTINPTNYNINYVDVSWSNNTGATIKVPVTTNTDSGNNTNWNFFMPVPTLTEWGMIIFTGLLLLSSIVIMKRRGGTASPVM